ASGATPLILAAAKGRGGVVRLLLDAGANPTLADSNDLDALAHARKGGCFETIALLHEALARTGTGETKKPERVPARNRKPFIAGIPSEAVQNPYDSGWTERERSSGPPPCCEPGDRMELVD